MKPLTRQILYILFLGGTVSCSSNVDEVLTGSVWECIELYPSSNIDTEYYNSNKMDTMLKIFPDVKYTYNSCRKEEKMDTLKIVNQYMKYSINFFSNTCSYQEGLHGEASIKRNEYTYRNYHFESGEYKSQDNYPNALLTITSDKILYSINGKGILLYTLNNGNVDILSSKKLIEDIEKEIITKPKTYILKFQHEGQQVLMENDHVKWIGELDTFNTKMDVREYDSEKKIFTLYLR